MFNFCCCLLTILLLSVFRNKRSLIVIILALKKENEILKRYLNLSGKTLNTKRSERFVLQQIIDFEESLDNKHAYLIHDNGSQYTTIDYSDYGITGLRTGIRATNMNAHAGRFIKSIRQEAFDHFILFSKKQINKIVDEYVNYYNKYRHHQGIDDISEKSAISSSGRVVCDDVLSGLHHHYYGDSA